MTHALLTAIISGKIGDTEILLSVFSEHALYKVEHTAARVRLHINSRKIKSLSLTQLSQWKCQVEMTLYN